jgi:hypothetical protein
MKLRAHHIYCSPFMEITFPDRSEKFNAFAEKINETFASDHDAPVTVIEGADELCRLCRHCVDGRCTSPNGDEDAVRKWDTILLSQTGTAFDTTMSAGDWRKLVLSVFPYRLCKKCRWKTVCVAGKKSEDAI